METIQFEYLNLITTYMLHALVESQSMGKLLYAFKNVRNMEKFLEENAHAPDGTLKLRRVEVNCIVRETTQFHRQRTKPTR